MDSFFILVTWLGSLYVLLPLCVVLFAVSFLFRKFAAGVFLLLSLTGASAITHLLKNLVARPRPASEDVLVAMPADFSFPSAHTSQATAFFLALCVIAVRELKPPVKPAIWVVYVTLAGLVGYSRLYLQVHYFTDVIAGAAVGILWVLFLAGFFKTSSTC